MQVGQCSTHFGKTIFPIVGKNQQGAHTACSACSKLGPKTAALKPKPAQFSLMYQDQNTAQL